jgi:protein-S-isoprenylcysteine O-methyltransferase Ste14
MDPINILVGVVLILSMGANFGAAKSGVRQTVTKFEVKPTTWLQKTPPNISALVLILTLLGVFNIGTLPYEDSVMYLSLRLAGISIFAVFSWLQVKATKNLAHNYSQDIAILKGHEIVTSGTHKYIRHPQYLSQVLSDLGAGIALFGFVIIPVVILVELPLFILRAIREEKLLESHFKDKFVTYKKNSGFIIPFIG